MGSINIRLIKASIIILLGVLFFCIPKDYLGDTYPICLFKIIFNRECIGCGTTRAVWSVLHFNFKEAFEYNKLIVLTFPLLTWCVLKWILKEEKPKQRMINKWKLY